MTDLQVRAREVAQRVMKSWEESGLLECCDDLEDRIVIALITFAAQVREEERKRCLGIVLRNYPDDAVVKKIAAALRAEAA